MLENFNLDYKNIILILITLGNLFLGFLVWLRGKGKTRQINLRYFLISLSVVLWAMGMIMYRGVSEVDSKLLWCRWLYAFATLIPVVFVFFCYHFPDDKTRFPLSAKFFLILSNIFFIFLSLKSNGVVNNIFVLPNEDQIIFGPFYFLYNLYIPIIFIWGFYILYKKYQLTEGVTHMQIKYVFLGTFISATLGMFSNLVLPTFDYFVCNWLGQVLTLIMVGFIAYAIIAHHLMDIKLVLRSSFAYLAPLITILVGYTTIQYLANLYLPDLINISSVVIYILSVLIFIPLKNFYYKLANKYFFSSLYDAQELISNLSDKLRSSLNTKVICDLVSKTLINSFHSKAVGILIYNNQKNKYFVEYNYNFKIKEQAEFDNDKLLQTDFAGKNKILITEEVRNNAVYKNSKKTINLLDILGVEILAPLNVKDKMVGLIALAEKESGDMYNKEDLSVLKVVGAQTAVALQNSLLYQESLRFGEKLKKEVEKATHDLRIANTHLKELDRAKTEFVSITSHQLRTPLTGIKGYLSMFLEGDFGSLKPEQKKIITDIFNNSNRLVRLINIFLNVSRIESGRLKLDKSKFDLIELIEEIMRELKLNAEKKNLKLELNKLKNKIEITGDRDKIADVIMNLIDNAIKYTEKGNIIINVKLNENNVQVKVKDSGIGISPNEAKTLFNKFTRGRKIAEINTSGSGLGLFIAKKIIELHNGKIWVESQGQGKGSEFIFEIPVK